MSVREVHYNIGIRCCKIKGVHKTVYRGKKQLTFDFEYGFRFFHAFPDFNIGDFGDKEDRTQNHPGDDTFGQVMGSHHDNNRYEHHRCVGSWGF
ncbi:hypothetical protein D3C73_1532520 [compost metagenome]